MISRETGLEILETLKRESSYPVFFEDTCRGIVCASCGGTTMLQDGGGWIPVQMDFLAEAKKSERFDAVGIMTNSGAGSYAGMVGAVSRTRQAVGRKIQAVPHTWGVLFVDSGEPAKNPQ